MKVQYITLDGKRAVVYHEPPKLIGPAGRQALRAPIYKVFAILPGESSARWTDLTLDRSTFAEARTAAEGAGNL